jgi:ABC-type uncharacterized transport system ATPase subunit
MDMDFGPRLRKSGAAGILACRLLQRKMHGHFQRPEGRNTKGSDMIKVEHLVKKFGLRTAVDDVSFEVEKGTVLGVLGPNGAGKTTTIRMIAGYLPPTSGR